MLYTGTSFFTGYAKADEAIDRRKVAKHGVEARLYAPMVAGIAFAVGCYIFGFTSLPSIHWVVPCIGLVILLGKPLDMLFERD